MALNILYIYIYIIYIYILYILYIIGFFNFFRNFDFYDFLQQLIEITGFRGSSSYHWIRLDLFFWIDPTRAPEAIFQTKQVKKHVTQLNQCRVNIAFSCKTHHNQGFQASGPI